MQTSTTVPIIRNEDDHRRALARVNLLIEQDDPAFDPELEALALLIENYESKTMPIEYANPVDVVKYRMKSLHMTPSQLATELHMSRSRVSEVLNYKRHMSKEMMRGLHRVLGISPSVLLQHYELHAMTGSAAFKSVSEQVATASSSAARLRENS